MAGSGFIVPVNMGIGRNGTTFRGCCILMTSGSRLILTTYRSSNDAK